MNNLILKNKNSIKMKFKRFLIYFLLPLFLVTSCTQDIPNPNAATGAQILGSTEGLLSMINGLKYRYTVGGASGLYTSISANGLSTFELQILNAGNSELAQLGNGGDNVSPDNGVLTNMWTNLNLMRSDAEKVIENAPKAINDGATQADVLAAASFFRALAIGTMAQYWEQVPLTTGENASFSTRDAALQEAVKLMGEAYTLLGTSYSEAFQSAVGSDLDFKNSSKALSARYNLMLGNLDEAKADADLVDLTAKSVFIFDNVSPNPVFRTSLITQNVYDVNPAFGLMGELLPDTTDGRIDFYLTPNAESGKGFFTSDAAPIPIHLPGEMILIKAEVAARQNNLGDAVTELDKILTKTDDIFDVNAALPVYSGAMDQDAILLEIYKNRCIELYMSGLKMEDSRRFNRPGPNDAEPERNRNFYPYPTVERDNNTNTPPDPEV
jgi:starch-binding outer membrane protein, SusD/RagB family